MEVKISAVVNTYNEEANIEECLRCLAGHVDEIVVSDMGSTDRTVEICRKFTDRVFFQPKTEVVEQGRARAVNRASSEWILVLDADERLGPALIARLRTLAATGTMDAVEIPFITYFFGRDFTGRGYPMETHARFFRKGTVAFDESVHRWGRIAGRTTTLPPSGENCIRHYSNPTVSAFIRKMNVYTDGEARRAADLGWQPTFRRLLLRPAKVFMRHYFGYRGYRSGRAGLTLATLMAVYWMVAGAKLWRCRNLERPRDTDPL